jgi:hypothetical protein
MLLYDLNVFIFYLNIYFKNYEIVLIESERRWCKYLGNKNNTKYYWLGNMPFNLKTSLKKGLQESENDFIAIWDFLTLVDPLSFYKQVCTLRLTNKRNEIPDSGWFLQNLQKRNSGKGARLISKIELSNFLLND